MVVAIDGPAGSGKSTVARLVAEKTGMFYLNSGNFYRAITWKVIRSGDPGDDGFVVECARGLDIRVDTESSRGGAVRPGGTGSLVVDGKPLDSELHSDEVDRWVARHSSIPAVRDAVNRHLTRIASELDIVVEGRDMTTVVFPRAEVKIYLDASIETRAKRRFHQGTSKLPLEKIEESIKKRDEIDRTKPHGSLRRSPDAVYVDASHLTIEQVCATVIANIQGHEKLQESQGSYER